MNPIDHGKIAARTLGILFLVVGLVMLSDFALHLQQSKQAMRDSGWSNFGPLEEAGDDGHWTNFLHDSTYVLTPAISPLGSMGFVLIGFTFLVFSPSIGRLIAGLPRRRNHGEPAGDEESANRPESK